ncbi:MAG TPA: undecaprenyldiphospho-muramoylpentapeptide beta-N-acetylglucosaminyltransferase [Kofleriaceae bacterium]|nr:undecaprenyldiphospho-muramoylpentapeptide beta-N-acetylglucosaminyltransferase [Kofleriaceae bacterium]
MKIMIAGGGTGGHLYPGVAIVEEIVARDPSAAVSFVGTARGIEARVVPKLGYPLDLIEVTGLKTMGLGGVVRGLLRLPRALWQSRAILKARRPDVVIGVGGYASGPVLLMARLGGIPTAILEQNSIPGLTNKILGKICRAVFLAFEETRRFFPARKVLMTGNPIRAAIRASLTATTSEESPGAIPHIFVFGGSQGAAALNAIVVDAVAALARRNTPVSIVHQTGERSLAETRARYEAAGITADVRAFIEDMAREYLRADVVIARAGATTIAELSVVGRPAILVPFPFAADDHQTVNARELADAGAAILAPQDSLTGESLADAIARIAFDPATRARMGSVMKGFGRPDAAAAIADWCEGAIAAGQKSGSRVS